MKKIFMSVATVIVTRFIMRVVDRIKNPPVPTREELHEEVLRKKREYDERRRVQPKVNVRFESTPRSPDAWMANIGTFGEFAAQYKGIPEPKEPCDGAALRPASIGCAMGSCSGRQNMDIKGWEELIKTVHHAFEYGFHCNDMTFGEIEDDISFALDKFAKENGLPEHDWDADYEETYGEPQAD